ncbi:MAG: SUMF1/EgtB/PvdO family nonheme iron enzyme [Saprospiraceae bacterium]
MNTLRCLRQSGASFPLLCVRFAAMFSLLAVICLLALGAFAGREPARQGKDYALFIAVDDYKYWPKLKNPIREVEQIAAELSGQYDFETRILRNPTQEEILTALRDYNSKEYPDDGQLLIYFSGHGFFDDLTRDGFFIPREGRLPDPVQTSYLSFSRLRQIVENNPCKHILLAIDACYSGTFDKLVAMRGDIIFGRPNAPTDTREAFIQRELTLRSRYFVASGKREQTPDASNFAAYFLRSLRSGGGDDEIVTIQELHAELIKANPRPHINAFGDHQDESNFLFIRKSAVPAPDAFQDRADWRQAEQQNTAAAYREYLRKQPGGEFRVIAEQRAQALETEAREIAAWVSAKAVNTCDAYKNFMRDYPQSIYRPLAEEGQKKLCHPGNMVFIRGGTFRMGCTSEQRDCDGDDSPTFEATVSDFYLGRYEVTVREFKAFVDATGYQTDAEKKGWSYVCTDSWEKKAGVNWKCDAKGNIRPASEMNHPVLHVSWYDAVEYCNWLSERAGLRKVYTISGGKVVADWNANGYRLPTDAEWEYAARGGSQSKGYKYAGSNNLDEVAWYWENSGDKRLSGEWDFNKMIANNCRMHPVGEKKPNELGLYDMSGNVWEWCWDWKGAYSSDAKTNPRGPEGGSRRVLRGGSWSNGAVNCRVSHRHNYYPDNSHSTFGFRVVFVP